MCFWFYSRWLFLIVPLIVIFACVLMCVIARRSCGSSWGNCCSHTHSNGHQQQLFGRGRFSWI